MAQRRYPLSSRDIYFELRNNTKPRSSPTKHAKNASSHSSFPRSSTPSPEPPLGRRTPSNGDDPWSKRAITRHPSAWKGKGKMSDDESLDWQEGRDHKGEEESPFERGRSNEVPRDRREDPHSTGHHSSSQQNHDRFGKEIVPTTRTTLDREVEESGPWRDQGAAEHERRAPDRFFPSRKSNRPRAADFFDHDDSVDLQRGVVPARRRAPVSLLFGEYDPGLDDPSSARMLEERYEDKETPSTSNGMTREWEPWWGDGRSRALMSPEFDNEHLAVPTRSRPVISASESAQAAIVTSPHLRPRPQSRTPAPTFLSEQFYAADDAVAAALACLSEFGVAQPSPPPSPALSSPPRQTIATLSTTTPMYSPPDEPPYILPPRGTTTPMMSPPPLPPMQPFHMPSILALGSLLAASRPIIMRDDLPASFASVDMGLRYSPSLSSSPVASSSLRQGPTPPTSISEKILLTASDSEDESVQRLLLPALPVHSSRTRVQKDASLVILANDRSFSSPETIVLKEAAPSVSVVDSISQLPTPPVSRSSTRSTSLGDTTQPNAIEVRPISSSPSIRKPVPADLDDAAADLSRKRAKTTHKQQDDVQMDVASPKKDSHSRFGIVQAKSGGFDRARQIMSKARASGIERKAPKGPRTMTTKANKILVRPKVTNAVVRKKETVLSVARERVDPELYISTAHWTRRFKIGLRSFDVPLVSSGSRMMLIQIKLIASLDGARTEIEFVDDQVELVPAPNKPDRLMLSDEPLSYALEFDPTTYRQAKKLQLRVLIEMDDNRTKTISFPLSHSEGPDQERIIPSSVSKSLFFSDSETAVISYRSAMITNGHSLSSETRHDELVRRLERLRLEWDPVWLPDPLSPKTTISALALVKKKQQEKGSKGSIETKKQKVLRPPHRGPTEMTYDFVTKRPLVPLKPILEPATIETAYNTIYIKQQFNSLLLQSNLPPKLRLIHRLHHSWTLLHPFAPSILSRELACWHHFAPLIHHFDASKEWIWFVYSNLVLNDRDESRGLLKGWDELMTMFEKEVKKIEEGRREGYEEWCTRSVGRVKKGRRKEMLE